MAAARQPLTTRCRNRHEFTYGSIPELHEHVEQVVMENGEAYYVARVSAAVAREALLAASSAGSGAILRAPAGCGKSTILLARATKLASSARLGYYSMESGKGALDSYHRGDIGGVLGYGGLTALGAWGSYGELGDAFQGPFWGEVSSSPGNSKALHGNNLQTTKPAQGYTLRDRDTGQILKYGETTLGKGRYSAKYLEENNAEMVFEKSGTKAEMHQWQHEEILKYKENHGGERPRLNKDDY